MNEATLRELLREVRVPGAEEAERRGLAVATAAFRERPQATTPRRHHSPRRLALALVIAALATGLLLSLASASVRHWVGDVFSANEAPTPRPGLTAIPGGGRLLVHAADGPWVVQPDGSRRLLGDYGEATWSPNGLFVAVAAGRTLTAVEPDGTPHWSLTARGPVSDPRWWPGRFRIAYRAGNELRVIAADGTSDRLLARGTAPVAPAWSPLKLLQIAYLEGAVHQPSRLVIADSENGEELGSAPALPAAFTLEWGDNGRFLLEASRHALRLRSLQISKLEQRIGIGPGSRLPLPRGARVEDAALAPHTGTVAAVVRIGTGRSTRSAVLVYRGIGSPRRLLTLPGRLSQVAFSPDARRLLVAWPEADQWLFLPLGRGRGRAVSEVAAAFSPGGAGVSAFPLVEGWCCAR